MNFPTEITELEAELARLRGIQDEQRRSLAKSTMPEVDGIFLASTDRLREEFERRLRMAKAERRFEVVKPCIPSSQAGTSATPVAAK